MQDEQGPQGLSNAVKKENFKSETYCQLQKMIENLHKFRREFKLERTPVFLMTANEKARYLEKRNRTTSASRLQNSRLDIHGSAPRQSLTKMRGQINRSLTKSRGSLTKKRTKLLDNDQKSHIKRFVSNDHPGLGRKTKKDLSIEKMISARGDPKIEAITEEAQRGTSPQSNSILRTPSPSQFQRHKHHGGQFVITDRSRRNPVHQIHQEEFSLYTETEGQLFSNGGLFQQLKNKHLIKQAEEKRKQLQRDAELNEYNGKHIESFIAKVKQVKAQQALKALKKQQLLVVPPADKLRSSSLYGKFDREGNYHVKLQLRETITSSKAELDGVAQNQSQPLITETSKLEVPPISRSKQSGVRVGKPMGNSPSNQEGIEASSFDLLNASFEATRAQPLTAQPLDQGESDTSHILQSVGDSLLNFSSEQMILCESKEGPSDGQETGAILGEQTVLGPPTFSSQSKIRAVPNKVTTLESQAASAWEKGHMTTSRRGGKPAPTMIKPSYSSIKRHAKVVKSPFQPPHEQPKHKSALLKHIPLKQDTSHILACSSGHPLMHIQQSNQGEIALEVEDEGIGPKEDSQDKSFSIFNNVHILESGGNEEANPYLPPASSGFQRGPSLQIGQAIEEKKQKLADISKFKTLNFKQRKVPTKKESSEEPYFESIAGASSQSNWQRGVFTKNDHSRSLYSASKPNGQATIQAAASQFPELRLRNHKNFENYTMGDLPTNQPMTSTTIKREANLAPIAGKPLLKKNTVYSSKQRPADNDSSFLNNSLNITQQMSNQSSAEDQQGSNPYCHQQQPKKSGSPSRMKVTASYEKKLEDIYLEPLKLKQYPTAEKAPSKQLKIKHSNPGGGAEDQNQSSFLPTNVTSARATSNTLYRGPQTLKSSREGQGSIEMKQGRVLKFGHSLNYQIRHFNRVLQTDRSLRRHCLDKLNTSNMEGQAQPPKFIRNNFQYQPKTSASTYKIQRIEKLMDKKGSADLSSMEVKYSEPGISDSLPSVPPRQMKLRTNIVISRADSMVKQ